MENVDLMEIVANNLIYVDTSSLMHTRAAEFFYLKLMPALQKTNNTIQVPSVVVSELNNCLNKKDEIKQYVYNLQIVVPKKRKRMRIRDTMPGTLLLYRMTKKKSTDIFDVSEDWQATLELAFDQEAIESLKDAYIAAAEGKTVDVPNV